MGTFGYISYRNPEPWPTMPFLGFAVTGTVTQVTKPINALLLEQRKE
jgi:hypothetical protein